MNTKSYKKAKELEAWAVQPANYAVIRKMNIRELAECALHLAGAATGEYGPDVLGDGRAAARLLEEYRLLKASQLI